MVVVIGVKAVDRSKMLGRKRPRVILRPGARHWRLGGRRPRGFSLSRVENFQHPTPLLPCTGGGTVEDDLEAFD